MRGDDLLGSKVKILLMIDDFDAPLILAAEGGYIP